jgi:glycosyltransferase involved in cell wall biosynthesis
MAETGTQYEYKGARTAPHPEERPEKPELDVAVVMPSYNEGLNALKTIASVALQVTNRKKAAIIVINNRPDASPEAKEKNMQLYTVLQLVKRGHRVDTKNPKYNNWINLILDYKLDYEVIDAFSDGHAHPDNNVGIARQIGLEHMQQFAKDVPHYIGTDSGDSWLTPAVVEAVCQTYERNNADALQIESFLDLQDMDEESMYAYRRWSLHWSLKNTLISLDWDIRNSRADTKLYYSNSVGEPLISRIHVMGGAGASVSKQFVPKVSYDPIATAEDTGLQFKLTDLGGTVENVSRIHRNAYVKTQPRISDRTAEGFGQTIGKFARERGRFGSIETNHPKAYLLAQAFFSRVSTLEDGYDFHVRLGRLARSFGIDERTTEILVFHYAAFQKTGMHSRAHHEFIEVVNSYFDDTVGKASIDTFIGAVEQRNEQYATLVSKELRDSMRVFHPILLPSWKTFKELCKNELQGSFRGTGTVFTPSQEDTLRTLIAVYYREYASSVFDMLGLFSNALIEKRKLLKLEKGVYSFAESPLDKLTKSEWATRFNARKLSPDEIKACNNMLASNAQEMIMMLVRKFRDIEQGNLSQVDNAKIELLSRLQTVDNMHTLKKFAKVAGWDLAAFTNNQNGNRLFTDTGEDTAEIKKITESAIEDDEEAEKKEVLTVAELDALHHKAAEEIVAEHAALKKARANKDGKGKKK